MRPRENKKQASEVHRYESPLVQLRDGPLGLALLRLLASAKILSPTDDRSWGQDAGGCVEPQSVLNS